MIFALLLIGLTTISLSAMELPVVPSSERRPMEESMFELHAQADCRLNGIEESVSCLENILAALPVDTAAQAGIEKVKRACNDALLQDLVFRADAKASLFANEQKGENKRIAADIRLLDAQLREHKAQQEARLAVAVDEQRDSTASVKTDLESLKAQLREQSRQQEQSRGQLQAQVMQLNAVNAQLATELEAQKNATKKVYLVGGAVCLFAAGTALYLGARVSQHDRDLYGSHESQNKNQSKLNGLLGLLKGTRSEVQGLQQQVTGLQQRPYVSRDHNSNLVYNDTHGNAPVKGAHVSKW